MFEKYTDSVSYSKIVDYSSVSDMWNHSVSAYGESIAITDDGKEYSYKDTEEDVARFRGVLSENGVKRGDRVAILSVNSYDFVKAYLAVTTLGAVAVLLPPHLDATAVFGCSMKFGFRALIYHPALEDKTAFLKEKRGDVKIISTLAAAETTVPAAEVCGSEPCSILFTGGTTGKSKGALLNNRAIMLGTKNGCYGYGTVFGQKYFLVLPLTHVFGLIRNLLTSLYTGSNLFICRNNKDMFRDIATFRPTMLVIVPALAEMALNLSKQFNKNMLGDSLKYIICGASAVSPYLIKEYKKIGITLLPGYGLTESANLVSGNPEVETKPESVGIPYEGQELRIVDGELWLKGDNMMTSYVGDEEENKAAYSDGWFRTGDLVRMDEDGFLYIVGRCKEVIVLPSGENISPAELEVKFNEITYIQDSLVYLSGEGANRVLTLEVLPRASELKNVSDADKGKVITEEINKVNSKLPSHQRIGKIVIRDTDFKRSPSMKILRNQQ